MAVLASVWAPLFWIGKPLGVLPLSLDRERFLVSRLSFVYTFCGAACFVLGGFQKTAAVLRKVFVEPLDGQQILTFVSHSIVNAFALLNVYFSTKCARRLAAMFNELHALAKVTKRVPTLSTAAHVRTLVLLLQVAVFFNYMFFALYEKSSQGVSELVVSALRVLSLTSITCIGSHFCALCLVLRALVRAVNAELALLLAREAHSDGPTLLQHQLLRLRFVYAKIFDICVDMNNVFGIFVLLALTQYNIYIHVEVFTLLRLLVDVTANPLNTWLFRHTQALTWAVVNVAKILAYFVCCSLVLSETKKTGAIVSKYLAKLPQGTVLQSIDCFSRAVAAMKLAFSANGFFAIDWEILFSSASACTVNTLILIQSYVNNNQQVAFEAE